MATDSLDKIVTSGVNLRKGIAMGMAEGGSGQSGQDDGSYDRSKAPKGENNPNVKDDMGMPETMPGMGSMMSGMKPDKY